MHFYIVLPHLTFSPLVQLSCWKSSWTVDGTTWPKWCSKLQALPCGGFRNRWSMLVGQRQSEPIWVFCSFLFFSHLTDNIEGGRKEGMEGREVAASFYGRKLWCLWEVWLEMLRNSKSDTTAGIVLGQQLSRSWCGLCRFYENITHFKMQYIDVDSTF